MSNIARLSILVPALLSTACDHAVIETGRTPGSPVIARHFQPSFIYGLVSPPSLTVAGPCLDGIARVETRHTFVEGLVAGLTAGIFTPTTLSVTCASGTSLAPSARVLDVGQAGTAARHEAVTRAAALSAETGRAV